MGRTHKLFVAIVTVGAWAVAATAPASAATFSNATPIDVSGYPVVPAPIAVSGLTGPVTDANVRINDLTHGRPTDIDIVLRGPNGDEIYLQNVSSSGEAVSHVTYGFDDAANTYLPSDSPLASGVYKPSGPGALADFNGIDPNGAWTLYVTDTDSNGAGLDQGAIAGGWTLELATADVVAPETTITSKPKKKTAKRQAVFAFASSEPGSTFECSIDGEGFAACISPRIKKVGRGRHSFQVRATDAAGNVDASPAGYSWKVKKKQRKRR